MTPAKWGMVAAVVVLVGYALLVSLINPTPEQNVQQSTVVEDQNIPAATNYAVDTTGNVSATDLASLNAQLADDFKAGHQIGVLIVPTTGNLSIEEYGIRVGEAWKVGDKNYDDGAIIIIATQDRKVRIEVGSGLEGTITDTMAANIIANDMTTSLKAGDWAAAAVSGAQAIVAFEVGNGNGQ